MSKVTGLSWAEVRRLVLEKLVEIGRLQGSLPSRPQRGLFQRLKQGDWLRKMTEEMIEYIRQPAVVRKWAGHSFDERAVLLRRRFPSVRVSGSTIGRYYRILHIKPKAVSLKKLVNRKTQLRINRETPIIRELLRMYLLTNTRVLFLDECMFTTKTYRKREYMTRG